MVPICRACTFTSLSACSLSVSGLPSGVKFVKLSEGMWVFTGAPTVCSTDKKPVFTVTFTVKNASGAQKFTQLVRVEPLPAWAVGTFDGYHLVETNKAVGTFTATVAKTGKVTGKTAGGEADTNFRAPYFSEVYSEDGTNLIYVLDTEVKYKDSVTKKTVTTNSTLYLMQDQSTKLGCLGGGDEDGCGVVSYQNGWKLKPVALPNFAKSINELAITNESMNVVLTLKFGAKGVVTVAGTADGKKVSAKSQVLPVKWQSINGVSILKAEVCVYIPAKGDFEGFCQVYSVFLTEEDDEFAEAKLSPPTLSTYLMEGSDRRYMLADLSAEGQALVGRVELRDMQYPIVMSSPHLQPIIVIVIIFYMDEYGMQQTMAPIAADGTFRAPLAEGCTLVGIKVCEEAEAL